MMTAQHQPPMTDPRRPTGGDGPPHEPRPPAPFVSHPVTDRQRPAATAGDIALLRRFEPVARFTYGEQFYPMDADRYITAARLCRQRPNDVPEVLVPRGALTVERLVETRRDLPGTKYFLNFAESLNAAQVLHFYRTSTLRNFHVGRGRLARVGLTARFADLLFSLTLLLRGKVPGGLAADAALRYQAMQAGAEQYCYYGRVVRENGYTALQYWFFYAFNDWRSSFNGVNDHESDWEMITVYIVEDAAGEPQPCWLTYSSHEFEGDDLRRRWDDPAVERVGEHPVIYVGAGSHANYYFRGEYLPVAEVPYMTGVRRAWRRVKRFWQETLRQGEEYTEQPDLSFFRIPFVDYARGDGIAIGPGQARQWELKMLQDSPLGSAPAWVDGYRGLWGLYTRDPTAGEDAPAGPQYNRDGTIRKMWCHPLGWGGLDKVPPPTAITGVLEAQRQRRIEEQAELQQHIVAQTTLLMGLEVESEAILGLSHLDEHALELRRRIREAAQALDELKARVAMNTQVLDSFDLYAAQIAAGERGSPRTHLRLPQLPSSPADLRLGRLAETWSAVSVGVLLLGFVVVTQFLFDWQTSLLGLLGVYFFIEALFRRQMQTLIRYLVIGLALIAGMVLLYEFFWPVVVTLMVSVGLLIIVENVREL